MSGSEKSAVTGRSPFGSLQPRPSRVWRGLELRDDPGRASQLRLRRKAHDRLAVDVHEHELVTAQGVRGGAFQCVQEAVLDLLRGDDSLPAGFGAAEALVRLQAGDRERQA